MIEFLSIVMLVFGILQIILFFKLWGMTNNVKKLTDHFVLPQNEQVEIKEEINNKSYCEDREYDKNIDKIKPNDKVIRIADGKEMKVDSINKGKFFCKANSIEGYKWYSKYEIKTIQKNL